MKNNTYRFDTIDDFNKSINEKTLHPLVSAVDFSNSQSNIQEQKVRISTGFYSVMFKGNMHCHVKYGRNKYDYKEGTLLFFAPEQVIEFEANLSEQPIGWGLFFHPDVLLQSHLGKTIRRYSFFSYNTSEALHLSESEKQVLMEIFNNIRIELNQNIDLLSKKIIVTNIELLLDYCTRYYNRQFITRTDINNYIVSKLFSLLERYFNSESLKENGLPSVKYCAEELNFSPNYLSDLLKKETGKNTQEHIHHYLIEKAKISLQNPELTVSEVAYELGFEYPQYFSKIFKSKTGFTPAEYRRLN